MVKRALVGLPGIKQATVSSRGKTVVLYDPAQVTVTHMVKAIERLGFAARPL